MTGAESAGGAKEHAAPRASRLPSLDGWRALSIALVLGEHSRYVSEFPRALDSWFYWAFDGDLGVRIFFIISGLLITWLLHVEHERTGGISLLHFYARRALRILPVYWGFLAVLALLQVLTQFQMPREGWIASFTFVTNFVNVEVGTIGHLWSLAVEEQFYLLWPGLFLLLALARDPRKWRLAVAIPLVVAPAVRVISYLQLAPGPVAMVFSGRSFLKYFDSLAIGCACAVVLAGRRGAIRIWMERHSRWVVAGALALILVPYVLTKLLTLGAVTIPFGPTFQGVGIAMLLLQSVLFPELGLYRLLNRSLVGQVGVLSYSIYIWQQIFCTKPAVFGWGPVWWMSFPLWLIAVGIAAFVSYYGLERPLFRLRARLRD